MANLIKDFWTYTYKEKNYYGICEVVLGEDLAQNRCNKKYETHIEKALNYTMENKVLSHMSVQTYCKWLNGRECREESEQKYYPFVIEFETKKEKENEYNLVVYQVTTYVNYLIQELGIQEDDILIMLNNSRSIYVFVNPKAYNLRPDKDLNLIYLEMYKRIKEEIGLEYVDESILSSGYKLMKTPNCYYNGGYYVHITFQELQELLKGTITKYDLTREKRTLDIEVPGQISLGLTKLYEAAKNKVKQYINMYEDGCKVERRLNSGSCKCVEYMLQHFLEQGVRNFGLVSIGIYLKNQGYSQDEVEDQLIQMAQAWCHDESSADIRSKVKTIFRRDYNFSCEYARSAFSGIGIENMCAGCPYAKNKEVLDSIKVNMDIINELWDNSASTRHYVLYLELLQKDLFNKWFLPEKEGINTRTLRELCKLSGGFIREKDKESLYIVYNPSKKAYRLPIAFLNNTLEQLGDYIKHYLKMLVKGYKVFDKYLLLRISKEKLKDELGYQDISSLYKMLKKLDELGLIMEHKNSVFRLYFESYRVKSIEEYREEKADIEASQQGYLAAASNEQIQICMPEVFNMAIGSHRRMSSMSSRSNHKNGRGSPG